MAMNKFISVLDYQNDKTKIICVDSKEVYPTSEKDEVDLFDEIFHKNDCDISNSDYITTDEFPLTFKNSKENILDLTIQKLREELIERIHSLFKLNPTEIIEFSDWSIYSNNDTFKLSYDEKKEILLVNGKFIKLREFCTDDLLFILESLV